MLRQWLIVAVCVFYSCLPVPLQARLCPEVRVSNNVGEFEQLRGCTVIVGSLKIVLIEKSNVSDLQSLGFPELTEIRGYLLLYRVKGLTTLGNLFPNLRVIRGQTLITDYSFVLYEVTHLQEIGLHNLQNISRGSTRIERCPNLCYVKTVDWSKIASSSHLLDTYDMVDNDCPSCPHHCNGLCWNQDNCQRTETDNCDPECFGCKGPTAADCYACRSYTDNQRCVSHCPNNKILHSLSAHCVTEKECPNLLNGTWWKFQGECVNSCPPGYSHTLEKDGWCEYCGEHCTKECSGTLVDSIANAQELRGCTRINGSLSIRIDSSKSIAEEMGEYLGMIEEIDGYLKIHRSSSIYSLDFFKKLKVIHGKQLDNRRHAFVVVENQNLQKLWNWDNFTLTIKNGTISFHYNPQLCLSEIQRLANITGLTDSYSSIDVSPLSNGDKTACKYSDLKVTIIELTSTNITLSWENFVLDDADKELHLIGYILYYIEDPLGNMTIYDGRDECGSTGWDSIFVSSNTRQIVDLKAFTQYAYYIKTYTTSMSIGGQTKIKRFTTLSDHPSVPLDVKTNSSTSNSVILTWKPPQHPNGILSYYDIVAYFQEDDSRFLAQRNYCKFRHRLLPEAVSEPPPDMWYNATTNSTCCKKEKKMSAEEFENLCEKFDTVSLTNSKPKACNSYMGWLENENYSDVKLASFPNNSNIIVRRVKDSNLTRYVFEPLRHFSMYLFVLKACNNESRLQCSSPIIVSQRTLKKENADDIPPGLTVDVEKYDAYIKWFEPKEPNSAIVSYDIEYTRTDLKHTKSVPQCITQQKFAAAEYVYKIQGFQSGTYSIKVRANSLAGAGTFSEPIEFVIVQPSHAVSPAVFIVPIVITILILVGLFYYFRYQKKKNALNHLHLIRNINPDYAGPIYLEDDWEMDRDDIDVSKELGQGTFGMVYSGYIKSKNRPCALKTINKHTDVHERMVFLNEASVMKSFSDAHHVVKLLGVVSRGEPPLVVMELMARGDLKSFLRRSRDSSSSITCAEMYRMAAEIADGMLYLTAKKFVHRDLAARNCMVGADHTVKIGDFGMTRDIYETDYYRKETRGLMPVRWMSPESLADGVFTTDSDVWSYGVVLWEMATLAEQPYQGLANEQVLQFVIAQGTLERPIECTDLLYEIMEACWKWRPNQRPLFADIVEKLELNVGQDFRLVSFYHSSGGEEYRMNAKTRVYNPPALTVPLGRNRGIHWNTSEDDISLYSSFESNRPTPLLSTFQNQSKKNTPSGDSYR